MMTGRPSLNTIWSISSHIYYDKLWGARNVADGIMIRYQHGEGD